MIPVETLGALSTGDTSLRFTGGLRFACAECLRSGSQRPAGPIRTALRALSAPYRIAVGLRNALYDRGFARSHAVPVPVVSVGNLTTGGTGKTPLVQRICRFYLDNGLEPVILSRGYGRGPDRQSDEVLLYDRILPGVRHYEAPSRLRAAATALEERPPDVFILDDGFQHRQMARALDVVVIDALASPFADRLLPGGNLREPVRSLRRAGVVILTRTDLADHDRLEALRRSLKSAASDCAVAETRFAPRRLVSVPTGEEEILDAARRVRAGAFAGIGSPENFRLTLQRIGVQLVFWRPFADHHWYSDDELAELGRAEVDILLTTLKDAVRIGERWQFHKPLYALETETLFTRGRTAFELLLSQVVKPDGAQE